MKARVPLYAQILLWFFLNLAAVAGVSWFVLRDQFRFSALPARSAGDRVEKAADQILADLLPRPTGEWENVLAEHSRRHGVEFRIVAANGRSIVGPRNPLPPEVHGRLFGGPRERQGPPGPPDFGPPEGGRRPPRGEGGPGPGGGPPRRPPPPFDGRDGEPPRRRGEPEERQIIPSLLGGAQQVVVQSASPDRYWVIVGVRQSHPELGSGAVVIASSDSPTGHGFFFDVKPYVWWGAGVLGLSILIWLPFVRSVTRSISRMAAATTALAEGKFDVQVEERRRDELGALGHEINRMARRLAGYVDGQKRFLGDVAHELSAPTARLQMALAILEQRASSAADRERIADVQEEVEHMSGLVNELLQFSRASVSGRKAELQPIELLAVVEKAVRREAGDVSSARIEVPAELRALADADLLLRAVSNLLRNSIRYAGHAGPITIRASRNGERIQLSVEDRGPGIPGGELPRIFEPFYRVDTARTPGAAGAGLGLAIVQTCVAACEGTVSARNAQPSGLIVTIELTAAETGAGVATPDQRVRDVDAALQKLR